MSADVEAFKREIVAIQEGIDMRDKLIAELHETVRKLKQENIRLSSQILRERRANG